MMMQNLNKRTIFYNTDVGHENQEIQKYNSHRTRIRKVNKNQKQIKDTARKLQKLGLSINHRDLHSTYISLFSTKETQKLTGN